MNTRRSLNLKLILSVFLAFAVSLALTWIVHDKLSERDAFKLLDTTLGCVEAEVENTINDRLVRQCMAVRERLEEGHPTDVASLQKLAEELRVTEICIADEKGLMQYSSVADYLAHDDRPALDFATVGGQAGEMMCLINEMETEFSQSFQQNSHSGLWRKYVAVWNPKGGFVQIGCDGQSLRELSRSSLVDLFRNWRIAGNGGIVITTRSGLVLSDYEEPNREGTQWVEPDNDLFYWKRTEIDSFPVYVMIPKESAAVERDVLVGATAFLNACTLIFVTLLVAIVIARFVRRQMQDQATKELEMAKEIQCSTLPNVFPPYPEETRFDIRASMKTAKEVGGDFYDFYYVGSTRLLFLIADVSGKGVPAALFMMRAKTLMKGAAQTGKPIAQVVSETNDALCEGNASNTFVTMWAGELNFETGVVTYVNAGHNPPVIRRNGKLEYLKTNPGLVLGAMRGFFYKAQEFKLEPNDAIYLYTDGITEQTNPSNELYGEARLLKRLSGCEHKQAILLDSIVDDVMTFAGTCEQADDCTQLVIRYRGNAAKRVEHSYKPTMEDLATATADLEAALEGLPMKEQMKLMVAADEIFANIVRYSGANDWTLAVEFLKHPDTVRLVFTDDGKPFDPLARRDPDTTLSAEERKIGGMGILIVKKTMSPVTYSRKGDRNVLTTSLQYGD